MGFIDKADAKADHRTHKLGHQAKHDSVSSPSLPKKTLRGEPWAVMEGDEPHLSSTAATAYATSSGSDSKLDNNTSFTTSEKKSPTSHHSSPRVSHLHQPTS